MASNDFSVLQRVPLFACLDERGLSQVAAVATEFDAPAGQVLVEIGQPGLGVFVIETGTVRIEPPGEEPIERGPGDFFGELAILTDHPRTARVSAKSDVSGLVIRRADIASLLNREPTIAVAMLREVAQRLVDLT
jgi:voltage-gated potassium channel